MSSDSGTDYRVPLYTKRIIRLTLVVSILAIGVSGNSTFVALGFAICAVLVRLHLLRITQIMAKASRGLRFRRAMLDPNIASARLAFHFSAVDLPRPDHVSAWEAALNETGLPWFVIVRECHHLDAFRANAGPPAIFVQSLTELANSVPPAVKAVFYANNAQKNRKMLAAFPQLTHVQLLHGDSDKPPSFSPLTKNYHRVFVAGQMAIDRYAHHGVHIPKDRFRIVGRPQVQALKPAARGVGAVRKQVLYMPTWRGFFEDTQLSSLDRAARIIASVPKASGVELTFKPHSMSYKDPHWPAFERVIRAALADCGGRYCATTAPVFDLYNVADVLITDISSVMIDFLYTGKPFLTVLPQGFAATQAGDYPSLAAAYQVQPDLADICAQLGHALGDDPMKTARAKVQAYAFGDIGQPPGAAFRAACHELLAPELVQPVRTPKQKVSI
ncbi:MAG: CDP-glycerol glycerophosphotransferase family protein [Paracoccaceae bacterium]